MRPWVEVVGSLALALLGIAAGQLGAMLVEAVLR